MPRGGFRPGAGRPPGLKNGESKEIRARATKEKITPLEYMLKVMNDEEADSGRRDRMAIAAATFIHARPVAPGKKESLDERARNYSGIFSPRIVRKHPGTN